MFREIDFELQSVFVGFWLTGAGGNVEDLRRHFIRLGLEGDLAVAISNNVDGFIGEEDHPYHVSVIPESLVSLVIPLDREPRPNRAFIGIKSGGLARVLGGELPSGFPFSPLRGCELEEAKESRTLTLEMGDEEIGGRRVTFVKNMSDGRVRVSSETKELTPKF